MEHDSWDLPPKDGLYDPELEKDACGVGFIVSIDGKSCHKVSSTETSSRYGIQIGVLCSMARTCFTLRQLCGTKVDNSNFPNSYPIFVREL